MAAHMRTVAIVQARMGSTRFPKKVMQLIDGVPMIGILLERLSNARQIHEIVLATSEDPRNGPLCEYVRSIGYRVFRGSEQDVLDRYYVAAGEAAAETVVRITGDCPLIDPVVVDAIIAKFAHSNLDYVSNVSPPTFPDGLDTEVFTFSALERAWRHATSPSAREHVTSYIRESGEFSCGNFANSIDVSKERWTVDEPEDLELIRAIFHKFEPRHDFGWREIMDLCDQSPELFNVNRHLIRNEGAAVGAGQKLWRRAKRVIPGGNMLLSKRAEMFLPEKWPAYFSKAKGCRVWDLDGREYVDMSIMGIG